MTGPILKPRRGDHQVPGVKQAERAEPQESEANHLKPRRGGTGRTTDGTPARGANTGTVTDRGGGLLALHSGEGDPLGDGPHVVGQAGGHRRRSRPPLAVLTLHPQCSRTLAEVGGERAEPRRRHVHLPRLRELVALPPLATAPPPIRPVVTLHEARVHPRSRQRHHSRHQRPEHQRLADPHHSTGGGFRKNLARSRRRFRILGKPPPGYSHADRPRPVPVRSGFTRPVRP